MMKGSVVLLLTCLAFSVLGQQKKLPERLQQKLTRADDLFGHGHYDEAIEAYQEVLESDGRNLPVKLKIADAYFRLPDMAQAGDWYAQAFEASESGVPAVEAHHLYQYAEILLSRGQHDDALRWYELYKSRNPADTRSDRKIAGILNMSELSKEASQYKVAEASLNSTYPDFSPAFYDNGLVFVSGRAEATAEKGKKGNDDGGTYLDLYYAALQQDSTFSIPEKINGTLNTAFYEGPAVFYDNDRKVIFTRNNFNSKLKRMEDERVVIHLQLFYAEKDAVTNVWKEPVLLPINSKDYSIGHPAISSNGQALYFSSNMPGGSGGTDLYVSKWENGDWAAPQNLGNTVNTEGNEMFPFLHADTLLYFSSNGHAGFGALDIYSFDLGQNKKVKNMGPPVNSSGDDFGVIINKTGDQGYFSSNRKSSGAVKDDDIYRFSFHKQEEPAPDTVAPVVYYTIQLFALKKNAVVRKSSLQNLRQVLLYKGKDGFNRYTYGKYNTLQGANEELQKIKAMGYNDAFVRREVLYAEMSKRPGIEVDRLYKR